MISYNYGDLAAVDYQLFVDTVGEEGFVVRRDDPGAARLRDVRTLARLRTYGGLDADLQLTYSDVAPDGTKQGPRRAGPGPGHIQAPGEHMALNSAAVLLAGAGSARHAGAAAPSKSGSVASGVHRRFESAKGVVTGSTTMTPTTRRRSRRS